MTPSDFNGYAALYQNLVGDLPEEFQDRIKPGDLRRFVAALRGQRSAFAFRDTPWRDYSNCRGAP